METKTLEGNTSELKRNTSGEKKTKQPRRYWVNRVEEVDGPKDQTNENAASVTVCDVHKENISLKGHSEKNYMKSYSLKSQEVGKADYQKDCRIDSANICSNVLCKDHAESSCKCCCEDPTESSCKCVCCCEDPAKSSCKYMCCYEEKTEFENKEIDREVSGSSEEKIPTAGAGEKSQLSKTYKNVLEEMVEKVNEKEKKQKIESEKQSNKVEATNSKNSVEKEDQKPDSENSEVLSSNWWTANFSNTNKSKNMKKGTQPTQDNNSKKKEVSNSNESGKKPFVSWWNSKSSTAGKTDAAAQKDNPKRKSGNSSSINNPSSLNPSAETHITNSEDKDETRFRRVLSIFYSLFVAGIVNFFFGLFSRALTGRNSNPESSAPESLPNPEVTTLIPEALRRRNATATVKEKSKVSSWMNKKNGEKNK